MDFTEELRKAKETMLCTFANLDLSELGEKITLEFNSRFTSCMGTACFNSGCIQLSQPLWAIAKEEDRYQTIVHEVCHIVTRFYYGFEVKSHGKEWKNFMVKCGVEPKRCHDVDRSSLKRKQKRFLVKCSCMVHDISSTRYNRMMRGVKYLCVNCRGRLEIMSYIEEFSVLGKVE